MKRNAKGVEAMGEIRVAVRGATLLECVQKHKQRANMEGGAKLGGRREVLKEEGRGSSKACVPDIYDPIAKISGPPTQPLQTQPFQDKRGDDAYATLSATHFARRTTSVP
jgi:hypothetical protein